MSGATRIGGILLAAGSGRRFGGDKREALVGEGVSVLARSLDRLLGAVDEVVLVIGAGDRATAFAERFPQVSVLSAPRSQAGMGSSLADAVAQCRHWDGCLVALADKPFVRHETVRRVRELLAAHALVVPTCDGEPGHPVGFARQHFLALTRLAGERGARALIEAERSRCLFVETGDPGVLADVDTPAQLAYWRALLDD